MNTVVTLLVAAVLTGTPLMIAAMGELVAERAGVINLGLEGMMLVGAATGFLVVQSTGSPLAGVLVAMLAASVLALLHAFFAITLRFDQVVSGLGIAILGTGLSALLGTSVVGEEPRAYFRDLAIPLLADIPEVGQILFAQPLIVYVGIGLALAICVALKWTRMGLHLRATGEDAAAADTVGISVVAYRYGAVLFGGAMAGMAGAAMSLAVTPGWNENMVGGRGWIAIALVIFGTWAPLRVFAGAYLFGTLDVLGFRAELIGLQLPSPLLGMIPYVATFVVLVVVTAFEMQKRMGAPAALGVAYDRESR